MFHLNGCLAELVSKTEREASDGERQGDNEREVCLIKSRPGLRDKIFAAPYHHRHSDNWEDVHENHLR
eukprot:2619301-Karenia_brevis.AAC.1